MRAEVSVTLTVIALRYVALYVTILSTLFSLNPFVVTTMYMHIYAYILSLLKHHTTTH